MNQDSYGKYKSDKIGRGQYLSYDDLLRKQNDILLMCNNTLV